MQQKIYTDEGLFMFDSWRSRFVVVDPSHLHPANSHQSQQLVAPEMNGMGMSIVIALAIAGICASQRVVPR